MRWHCIGVGQELYITEDEDVVKVDLVTRGLQTLSQFVELYGTIVIDLLEVSYEKTNGASGVGDPDLYDAWRYPQRYFPF